MYPFHRKHVIGENTTAVRLGGSDLERCKSILGSGKRTMRRCSEGKAKTGASKVVLQEAHRGVLKEVLFSCLPLAA